MTSWTRILRVWITLGLMLINAKVRASFHMLSRGQMHVMNAGDDVTLECQFHMEGFDLFYNPILWQKVQYHEISELNIMVNIKPPFDITGKFRVSFNEQPPAYMLRLTIIDLALEDSGNYTCDIRAPGSALIGQVTHRIFVRAPILNVDIYTDKYNHSIPAGLIPSMSLKFMEFSPRPLQCVVTGGTPPPDVTLSVAHRDVTGQFYKQTFPRVSGEKGFRLMQTVTILWTDRFMVSRADSGKRFNCRATVAGLGAQSASALIRVNYAPVISCRPSLAYLGDRNVHLSCEVVASPAVTTLFWMLDNNGTVVSEGHVINEYWVINLESGDSQVSKLFMRQTDSTSFRTYTIVAENEVAVSSATIELVQAKRDPEPPAPVVNDPDPDVDPSDSRRRHNGYIFIQSSGYQHPSNRVLVIWISVLAVIRMQSET